MKGPEGDGVKPGKGKSAAVAAARAGLGEDMWLLSELSERKRCEGALKVAAAVLDKDDSDYRLKRLVRGLASPRLGSRAGFALALAQLLRSQALQPTELFHSLRSALPLVQAEEETKGNAVGRLVGLHVLVRALPASHDSAKLLVSVGEDLLELCTHQADLRNPVAAAIAALFPKLKGKEERRQLWTKVHAALLPGDWAALDLHGLALLAAAHKAFPKIAAKSPIIRGAALFDPPHVAHMGRILGAGGESAMETAALQSLLLDAAAGAEDEAKPRLQAVWAGCAEKLLESADGGLETLAEAAALLLGKDDVEKWILPIVLSTKLLPKLAEDPSHRKLVQQVVVQVTRGEKTSDGVRLVLAKRILKHAPRLDYRTHGKLFGSLVQSLDDEEAAELVKCLQKQMRGETEKERRDELVALELLFEKVPKQRAALLGLLHKLDGESVEGPARDTVHAAKDRCLASLCVLRLATGGRTSEIHLSPDAVGLLSSSLSGALALGNFARLSEDERAAVEETATWTAKLGRGKGPVVGLAGLALFLCHTGPSGRVDGLAQSLRDLATCASEVEGKSTEWGSVALDVVLALLSLPVHAHRPFCQICVHYLSGKMSPAHLAPVLSALDPTKDAGLSAEEDPEGPFDADDEGGDEEGEESEEESEEDGESEEEELETPNEKLLKALKEGLGSLAADSDSDNDSVASDLSEDTMSRLDGALAEAFRAQRASTGAGKRAERVERDEFRMRIFDLVMVLLHSAPPPDLLASLLPQLLRLYHLSLHKSTSQHSSVLQSKTLVLIQRLVRQCRAEGVGASEAVECLEGIAKVAEGTGNPQLHLTAGEAAASVVGWVANGPEEARAAVVEKMGELLGAYVEPEAGKGHFRLPKALFTTPFTRQPATLFPLLKDMADRAFGADSTVKPFKKADLMSWARLLLVKNLPEAQLESKAFRKGGERFVRAALEALERELGRALAGEKVETKVVGPLLGLAHHLLQLRVGVEVGRLVPAGLAGQVERLCSAEVWASGETLAELAQLSVPGLKLKRGLVLAQALQRFLTALQDQPPAKKAKQE